MYAAAIGSIKLDAIKYLISVGANDIRRAMTCHPKPSVMKYLWDVSDIKFALRDNWNSEYHQELRDVGLSI